MIRSLLIGLVFLYRFFSGAFHFLSSIIGLPFGCKYPITCSEFALDQLREERNLRIAVRRVVIRLLSCGPWAKYFSEHKRVSSKG